MNITKIFRIYDSKADQWMGLIESRNAETATRSLTQAVNTPEHTFNLFAEDYTLFEVGYYTDDDPIPVGNAGAESICHALSLRETENAPAQIPFQMPLTNGGGVQWPDRPAHTNNVTPEEAQARDYIKNAAQELVEQAETERHNNGPASKIRSAADAEATMTNAEYQEWKESH